MKVLDKSNVHSIVRCVFIHQEKEFAEPAAELVALQWNHSKLEKNRNLEKMLNESNDRLPCHLVLTFKDSNKSVVAHVKIVRANGRGDGQCAIFYSLVVAPNMRGLGLGRILTEYAEHYVRSLNIAYVYVSTPDMALFYEHIGYKRCDPISSMKTSSKQLSASQVSSLEELFAKRANIAVSNELNIWLRKRLIDEYDISESFSHSELSKIIKEALLEKSNAEDFICFFIETKWQQQIGPSCGISAITMLNTISHLKRCNFLNSSVFCGCACVLNELSTEPKSCLEWALKSGISNDGEIFCAYNLVYLAEKCFQIPLVVSDITEMTKHDILHNILRGNPVVITYDRSLSNHVPGFFQGLHAHWTLVVGFVVPKDSLKDFYKNPVHVEMINEHHFISLFKFSLDFLMTDTEQYFQIFDSNSLWVVCVHGMSSHPFVCLLDTLLDSNRQLTICNSPFFLSHSNLIHLRNKIVYTNN
ncbi:uncharacterized protein LOC101239547 [Hydra vulgaris]|uniref:Uncharacterized protein LOC101239547 n=1 Tax=Hydra vulgaris TaxID=6087 RepID=A0ABM4CXW5_HYDVU